ncbi:MAG: multicopper oxidase family protein [Acidobacteriaceae bacterium]
MSSQDRRNFLKLCAASVPALAVAKRIGIAETTSPRVAQSTYRTPASLDRFIDPLPIPKRLMPVRERKGRTQYRVRMMEFRQQMHSQLPPTRLWGYEGQYPGPTIEAMRGKPVDVLWQNDLPAQHIFPIDPHIHGAMPPTPPVRTVTHLHGSRTTPDSDGMPELWFTPGHSALYRYPNDQQAATLWYHDHAVGITRLNVYAGLAGFYLLRDDEERSMDLPSGDYEIPLQLQDRTLDDQGQLLYAPTGDEGGKLPPGVWGPQLFGDLPVVNGAIFPYLEVEPRRYRLRVLNGANQRFFHLFLNLAKRPTDVPKPVAWHQIGSDGGLLSSPVPVKRLLLGPAERADLIVDFSGLEGKTATLTNDAFAPYPGWGLIVSLGAPLYELMQFRVTRPLSGNGKSSSMPPPQPLARLEESSAVVTRTLVLSDIMDAKGNSLVMRINGKTYGDPVTEFPKLNSIEKWQFINTTDDAHAMHLHMVQFQILHRQSFDPLAFQLGKLEFVGPPRPPAPNEAGWKDTAVVNPRDVLTIIVQFKGYTGRYGYHCHMLEHEDNDMMRPFVIVADES